MRTTTAAAILLSPLLLVFLTVLVGTVAPTSTFAHAAEDGHGAHLAPPAYQPLQLGSLRPLGWMKSQLGAQTSGLCGNRWLGVGGHVNDTLWIGGHGYDNLEEAYPYWLNGALPLAVLTNDTSLIEDIETQLGYIFDVAKSESGWLGPNRDGNPWSSFRFCTALAMYIDATSDARAVQAMFDHASALLARMARQPLQPGGWEHSRWQELLESYQWLLTSPHGNEATDEQRSTVWQLMHLAMEQGFDWPGWVESNEDNPFVHCNQSNVRGWFPNNTLDADSIGNNRWMPELNRQGTHGVNIGQAMQTWHLMYRLTSDPTWLDRGRSAWDKVFTLHGQATGVPSGDETLAGLPPNRGTETCGVVEIMNSAATAFMVSGDVRYLDQLERIAYNALPAAFFNGTMWSLNYYQQVNKLDAMDGQPDHCEGVRCEYCYGMVYECCVSNHVQGWPKFVMRQLQLSSTSGNLAITQYFASETTRPIVLKRSQTIGAVRIETDYPFSEKVVISVVDASDPFTLELRIPGWCEGATIEIDGVPALGGIENGTMHDINLTAGSHEVVLTLPMQIQIERRPPYILSVDKEVETNAVTVVRGPIVYGLPRRFVHDIGTVFNDADGDLPIGQAHAQNNYLLATDEWRHALVIRNDYNPGADLTHVPSRMPPIPNGQGPFAQTLVPDRIVGRAVKLSSEEWDPVRHGRGSTTECAAGSTSIDRYNTSWADLPPRSPVQAFGRVPILIELLPYGATDLRIAEFATTTLSGTEEG